MDVSSTPSPEGLIKGYFDPNIPQILPHENMYKIQIGSNLFKISGASLSSDGPSYFTNYFSKIELTIRNCVSTEATSNGIYTPHTCNTVLFIDRSAQIFELIYQHLQGYYIDIKDEVQYTMLLSDAVYYNLPRLLTILRESEYYFTRIGYVSFKLSKGLFQRDGDEMNYFRLISDTLYVDVERVIATRKLIRPPPHSYSYVARSPTLFEKIVTLLTGSELTLDDNERESLIKECRYYRLLNLEQKLIKCKIVIDPMEKRDIIWLKMKDISKRGLCCYNLSDEEPSTKKIKMENDIPLNMYNTVLYKRPYIDDKPRRLQFQIDESDCRLKYSVDSDQWELLVDGDIRQLFEDKFGKFLAQQRNINFDNYRMNPSANKSLTIKIDMNKCNVKYNGKTITSDMSISGTIKSSIDEMIHHFFIKKSVWEFQESTFELELKAVRLEIYKDLLEFIGTNNFL